jgi:histone deacetylase 1/2
VELLTQLQSLKGAPSVQMQEVPPDFRLQKETGGGSNDGGLEDDERDTGGERKEHEAEFYDRVD